MSRLLLILVCTCLVLAPAIVLSAQAAPDTTNVFHPGAWGIGFVVRNSVTEAGLLRFSTPTRAWVLDGTVSINTQKESGTGIGDQTQETSTLNAQLGPRFYHALNARASRYLGIGLSGGYAHSKFTGNSSHNDIWSIGAYGELGMQYMITRYLGIGWRGTLSGSRSETNSTEENAQGGTATQQATAYHLGLDAVQLTGTIYF